MQAGRLLAEAFLSGRHLASLGTLRPRSRREAYEAQDAMARAVGLPVSAWKVGAATPAVMAERDLEEPIPGPVYGPRVFATPATLPGTNFGTASLESEFAFRMKVSLPPGSGPYAAEDLARTVTAHAAFDLTQSRFSEPPDVLSEIADSGNCGAAVIGPEIHGWQKLDLVSTAIVLRLDGGRPVGVYKGSWRRDPLDVLTWLVNSLSQRQIALAEGTYVLTGSVTQPQAMHPGMRASAMFEGAGGVRVRIGNIQ